MERLPKDINYTQVPNIILDEMLSSIKSSDLKVCMLICRKTFGFHKQKDSISLSQMTDQTGLAKNTVIKAIERLEKEKIIIKYTDTIPHQYSINRTKLWESHSADLEPEEVHNLNCNKVQKLNTQKKTLKKKKRNTTTDISYEISENVAKVIDIWNGLFDIKISNGDKEMIERINNALKQFSLDELRTALYNRSGAKFYENQYGLKHIPGNFFKYPVTIRADLDKKPENLFTYDQMIDRVTTGRNKQSDFEILHDMRDQKDNPMWKLKY